MFPQKSLRNFDVRAKCVLARLKRKQVMTVSVGCLPTQKKNMNSVAAACNRLGLKGEGETTVALSGAGVRFVPPGLIVK